MDDEGLNIGFSSLNPCDHCGAMKQTAWINGTAGLYGSKMGTPFVAPPANYDDTPDRLVELHIYLCEDCIRVALSRTEPEPPALADLGMSKRKETLSDHEKLAVIRAAERGTGRTLTDQETRSVLTWAHRTVVGTTVLEQVAKGNFVMIAAEAGPDELRFTLAPPASGDEG